MSDFGLYHYRRCIYYANILKFGNRYFHVRITIFSKLNANGVKFKYSPHIYASPTFLVYVRDDVVLKLFLYLGFYANRFMFKYNPHIYVSHDLVFNDFGFECYRRLIYHSIFLKFCNKYKFPQKMRREFVSINQLNRYGDFSRKRATFDLHLRRKFMLFSVFVYCKISYVCKPKDQRSF